MWICIIVCTSILSVYLSASKCMDVYVFGSLHTVDFFAYLFFFFSTLPFCFCRLCRFSVEIKISAHYERLDFAPFVKWLGPASFVLLVCLHTPWVSYKVCLFSFCCIWGTLTLTLAFLVVAAATTPCQESLECEKVCK